MPRLRRTPPAPEMLPEYCDLSCPHASFAPNDAVGACRREQAVYCALLRKFAARHRRCLARDAPAAHPARRTRR